MESNDELNQLMDETCPKHEIKDSKRPLFRLPWVIEPLVVLYMAVFSSVDTAIKKATFRAATRSLFPVNHTFNHSGGPCIENLTHDLVQVVIKADMWNMYQTIGEHLIGIFSMWIMGALCDRYGRRIVLLLPPIGDILHALLFIMFIKLDLGLGFTMFTLVRAIFGSRPVFLLGCYCYTADTTTPESRSFRLTVIQVFNVVCVVLTELVGSHLLTDEHFLWPFIVQIITMCLTLLYIYLLVPETLQTNRVESSEPDRWRALQQLWRQCVKVIMFLVRDENKRRWRFWVIMWVHLFYYVFYAVGLFGSYIRHKPFCWGAVKKDTYNVYNIAMHSLGALLCTKIFSRYISDGWQGTLGALSGMLMFYYWFFIVEEFMVYFMPVFGFFSFVVIPISLSILSKRVRQNEQGSAMGLYFMLSQVCFIMNSVILYKIYRNTKDIFYGHLPLLITATLRTVSVGLMLYYTLKAKLEEAETRLETF